MEMNVTTGCETSNPNVRAAEKELRDQRERQWNTNYMVDDSAPKPSYPHSTLSSPMSNFKSKEK